MATGLQDIPDFIRKVLYPSTLGSFRDSMPSGELTVMLHTEPTVEPKEIVLKNMFPFMTLQDIKTALYIHLEKDPNAIPEFTYLCAHGPTPGGNPYKNKGTVSVDYTWNQPSILSTKELFYNALPFELVTGAKTDPRFVESNGERRLISIVNRERVTIEDAFLKGAYCGGKVIPEFHLYLYRSLLKQIPGPKPPSEKDWNGRLYPFFPYLPVGTEEPTAEQKARAERLAILFSRRQQLLMRLQSILDEDTPLSIELTLAGVKYLQLTWAKKKNIAGIETPFYEAAVNERRPFMRLLPVEGAGITKIYMADGKIPDIQDPKLLIAWSQERNPTPEKDYVFAKILIRNGLTNVAPIYGTLRLFDEGTADYIIEPPRGFKKLDPRTDLPSLGETIVESLKGISHIDTIPDIKKATFVLGIRLKKENPPITTKMLRDRLPIFTSFFQEIAPLPGEKPILMLRFKVVSNFATEDRIQTFITQVIHRKVLRGEGIATNLVDLVADEFQIDMAEARKQVAKKFQAQGAVAIVNPASSEYMHENNSGIDIAIFAQHPFYTFHLYNVNSLENLQRIITAMSLMIGIDAEELKVGASVVKELQRAEGVESEDEESVADAPDAPDAPETPEVPEVPAETPEVPANAPANAPEVPADAPANADENVPEELPDYLDFFAYEQDDQMTEEEAKAAQQVATQQGTPYSEELIQDNTPAPVRADPLAAPVEELKREIAKATATPKEDLQGAHIQPVKVTAPVESEDESSTPETGIANFFLNKLHEADRRLFDYTKSHPSLKRYVSQCQPTHGRQPAVLSEAQFQRMQEEYANDPVYFQIFPIEPGEESKPEGVIENDYYTVLRYGTTAQNQNYYICCRYFCTKDEIMIRESDLESSVMRRPKGAPKRPGECPFCKGKVIQSRRYPKAGETILEREMKPNTGRRHLYIKFLKAKTHPEGFYLPCCFMEESPIQFTDPAFDRYREWGEKPKTKTKSVTLEDSDEEEEQIATSRDDAGIPILDYYVTLAGVTKKYIVGAEKMPLDVSLLVGKARGEAQVGLLPPIFDTYFNQDSTQLVSRTFNPQKIKEGGTGFLRIGVENRARFQNDSFLAAVAPYYMLNNADQMKSFLLSKITPRIFLGLNYGNMVLEFYDPANSTLRRPKDSAIMKWASDELQVDVDESNREAIVRAYMSYYSFEEWLKSDKTKKEFRHFALALSQSNLITRKAFGVGTTFIVLDILKSGKVSVRCPPYGYNAELMAQNNVAFLMHHWSGIWEPIFYVDNRSVEQRGMDIFTLIFQMTDASVWPDIVTQRLQEYMNQCSSNGRAAYTSQSKIHPMAMIPASISNSIFIKELSVSMVGIIRDAYNHLGALVYKFKTQEGYIALPVVDDGRLFIKGNLFLDWDDPAFKPASLQQVLQFYKMFIEPHFALYKGYVPRRIVKGQQSGEIEAIQLRNGLYVPVGPTKPDVVEKLMTENKLESVTVGMMEWKINHDISFKEESIEVPGEKARMDEIEFQEVFEHLRIRFSNWLAAKEDGGDFRELLKSIIFSHKLPMHEKRKALSIHLWKTVQSWITTDFTEEDKKRSHETSLLRVDCHFKNKEACGGRCAWREEKGKCLLHVPKETHVGGQEKAVSAPEILLARLIEELLRYAEKRRQLLEQDVSRLATLDKPVTIEGNQRIYPEKSAAWYELLRLDWATTKEEVPKFYEEMSRIATATPLAPQDESTKLPPTLENFLQGGEPDPKTGALRLKRGTFDTLLAPIGMTSAGLGIGPDTKELDDKTLARILHEISMPVIQIDIRSDPPKYRAFKPIRPSAPGVPVFIITEEGPALLLLSPELPQFLTRDDMPRGLKQIYEKADSLLRFRKP
ncbi:hypothetical protein EBR66_03370 [bacterium]|nr:hypothetical protein [bacterium]